MPTVVGEGFIDSLIRHPFSNEMLEGEWMGLDRPNLHPRVLILHHTPRWNRADISEGSLLGSFLSPKNKFYVGSPYRAPSSPPKKQTLCGNFPSYGSNQSQMPREASFPSIPFWGSSRTYKQAPAATVRNYN